MSRIIEALFHEHENIKGVLDVLEREIATLVRLKHARRADFTLIWSAIDYFTDFPDLVHHRKEDLVFERLRQADPAAALSVGDLVGSHAALAAELAALGAALKSVMDDKNLPRAELVERSRAFIEHQRLHLAMEEARFFPVAERTLDRDAWAELETTMMARLDPLVGGPSAERFEAQSRHIKSLAATRHPVAS